MLLGQTTGMVFRALFLLLELAPGRFGTLCNIIK